MTEDARQLISLLRHGALRCRTGILTLARSNLGSEPDMAARLEVDSVDYAQMLLWDTPEDARFLGLSPSSEEQRLYAIAMCRSGMDCVLVYNFDLAMSRLTAHERELLWGNLLERFPNKPRALVLVLPEEADHLLPDGNSLNLWRSTGRVASAVI